ncbi:MAG: hypothetical protein IKB93_15110, partial [Clostridia bacterium]|nr:hypothetical protein [Clostridia bacterium]
KFSRFHSDLPLYGQTASLTLQQTAGQGMRGVCNTPSNSIVVSPFFHIHCKKLLHFLRRQLRKGYLAFTLPLHFVVMVAGFVLEYLFAKAVKGVLLVSLMA